MTKQREVSALIIDTAPRFEPEDIGGIACALKADSHVRVNIVPFGEDELGCKVKDLIARLECILDPTIYYMISYFGPRCVVCSCNAPVIC